MLTRNEVKNLRTELQHHLDAISEQVGYKLTLGNASFGATVNFKLEAAPINENGEATSGKAEAFKLYAPMFGLKPEHLNAEFTSRGDKFKVVGFAPKSRKFPVLAERLCDGKVFKFPVESIKSKLAG